MAKVCVLPTVVILKVREEGEEVANHCEEEAEPLSVVRVADTPDSVPQLNVPLAQMSF